MTCEQDTTSPRAHHGVRPSAYFLCDSSSAGEPVRALNSAACRQVCAWSKPNGTGRNDRGSPVWCRSRIAAGQGRPTSPFRLVSRRTIPGLSRRRPSGRNDRPDGAFPDVVSTRHAYPRRAENMKARNVKQPGLLFPVPVPSVPFSHRQLLVEISRLRGSSQTENLAGAGGALRSQSSARCEPWDGQGVEGSFQIPAVTFFVSIILPTCFCSTTSRSSSSTSSCRACGTRTAERERYRGLCCSPVIVADGRHGVQAFPTLRSARTNEVKVLALKTSSHRPSVPDEVSLASTINADRKEDARESCRLGSTDIIPFLLGSGRTSRSIR